MQFTVNDLLYKRLSLTKHTECEVISGTHILLMQLFFVACIYFITIFIDKKYINLNKMGLHSLQECRELLLLKHQHKNLNLVDRRRSLSQNSATVPFLFSLPHYKLIIFCVKIYSKVFDKVCGVATTPHCLATYDTNRILEDCEAKIAPHMTLLMLSHCCQLSEWAQQHTVMPTHLYSRISHMTMTGGKRSSSYQIGII